MYPCFAPLRSVEASKQVESYQHKEERLVYWKERYTRRPEQFSTDRMAFVHPDDQTQGHDEDHVEGGTARKREDNVESTTEDSVADDADSTSDVGTYDLSHYRSDRSTFISKMAKEDARDAAMLPDRVGYLEKELEEISAKIISLKHRYIDDIESLLYCFCYWVSTFGKRYKRSSASRCKPVFIVFCV